MTKLTKFTIHFLPTDQTNENLLLLVLDSKTKNKSFIFFMNYYYNLQINRNHIDPIFCLTIEKYFSPTNHKKDFIVITAHSF